MTEKYLKFEQDGQEYNLYDLPDGFVIDGDLDISGKELTELPDLSGVVIKGNFDCSKNKLTSLEGCPQEIGGNFNCSKNKFTSLMGAPEAIGGDFDCTGNNLFTLAYSPQEVGGDFICAYNPLISFKGAPDHPGGSFKIDAEAVKERIKKCPYLSKAVHTYNGWWGDEMSSLGKWFRYQCQKNNLDPIEIFGWNYDEDFDSDEYNNNWEGHPEWDNTSEYAYNFMNSGSNSRWSVVEEYIEDEDINNIIMKALNIVIEYGDLK